MYAPCLLSSVPDSSEQLGDHPSFRNAFYSGYSRLFVCSGEYDFFLLLAVRRRRTSTPYQVRT